MEKQLRTNGEITSPIVHLIMEDGHSVGKVSLDQARYLAEQSELDLVELSRDANPPIVKLLDYNKYRYQQEKHARGNNKGRGGEMKEVRLSFGINTHDLSIKAKRAKEFLDDGNFVRVSIKLRGRENVFPEKARQSLEQFGVEVGAEIEKAPQQSGKTIEIILKPKKK